MNKNSPDNSRFARFKGAIQNLQLMRQTGAIHSPAIRRLWSLGNLQLTNGKHAAKYQGLLANLLMGPALARQFAPAPSERRPHVPPKYAVLLGYDVLRAEPVVCHRNLLTHSALVGGASGSGKTQYVNFLGVQVLRQNAILPSNERARIEFIDRKGEGRRYINHHRSVAVLRPDQVPWNILEPVGNAHHEVYWAAVFQELGKAFALRPETWPELVGIMLRIEKGMKPGGHYPSLQDFEGILRTLATKEERTNLATAARAIFSLGAVLGKTARIRKAPPIDSAIIIYESANLPLRIDACLEGIRHVRIMAEAQTGAHVTTLRNLMIVDEGSFAFGERVAESSNNHIPAWELNLTQNRATGSGCLINMQSLSSIKDVVLANIGTAVIRRCPHPKDAKLAHQIVHVPETEIPEIQKLPVNEAYVWSEGFESGVRVRVPNCDLGPYPADSAVDTYMAPVFEDIDKTLVLSPVRESHVSPISYAEVLGDEPERNAPKDHPRTVPPLMIEDFVTFLRQLTQGTAANLSTSELYTALGWGRGKATRVRDQLRDSGFIAISNRSTGSGRPRQIIIITQDGEQFLRDAEKSA